eukprot:2532693-Ditylum_brightwellii.AAC.1
MTQLLLRHYPKGAMVKNNDGNTPLSKMRFFCLQFVRPTVTMQSSKLNTIVFGVRNRMYTSQPKRIQIPIAGGGLIGHTLYANLHEAWDITSTLA